MAKEQFAHRETEELLAMLDGVAAKTGSRGHVFDDWITMTVCALAGGTMEEEYLATVARYTDGEKGKRPVDQLAMAKLNPNGVFVGQDADLRCVKITAINLGLRNLYGYAIWGNSLSNERKLVYATGFNGKGVIRKVAGEEMPTIPPVEPVAPPREPLERIESEGKASQGSLFDGLE